MARKYHCKKLSVMLLPLTVFAVVVAYNFLYEGRPGQVIQKFNASLSNSICPPGFGPTVINGSVECICGNWSGVIVCDEHTPQASIQVGYCMTYNEQSDEINIGLCPVGYHRGEYRVYYSPLPSNVSELDEVMCGPFNREGRLCGQCKEGFSTPIFTYPLSLSFLRCVDCKEVDHGWVKYLVLQLFTLTLFFLLILSFGVSATSAPANGFIFFSQIYGGLYPVYDIQTLMASQVDENGLNSVSSATRGFEYTLHALYSFWNLKFLYPFVPPFCVAEGLSPFHSLAISYGVTSLYSLGLLILIYTFIELHGRNIHIVVWCWKPFQKLFSYVWKYFDPSKSIIQVFASFMLLSYVNILSFIFVVMVPVPIRRGDYSDLPGLFLYYQATQRYFKGEHIPYAIVSIILFCLFVLLLPTVLILHTSKHFQRCVGNGRMRLTLQAFVDAFQGCYKDGTDGSLDCRYFAAFYFVIRIAFAFSLITVTGAYFAATATICIFASLAFATLRPYKDDRYNTVDAFMFAILATIYMLVIFHGWQVVFIQQSSHFLLLLVDLLSLFPLLYMTFFVIYWVFIKRTKLSLKAKQLLSGMRGHITRQRQETETSYALEDSLPDRLLNPHGYVDMSTVETNAGEGIAHDHHTGTVDSY